MAIALVIMNIIPLRTIRFEIPKQIAVYSDSVKSENKIIITEDRTLSEIAHIKIGIKDIEEAINLIWKEQSKEALAIAKCESGLNPETIGDSGKSIGIFQIYLPAHPQYKEEDLMNVWYNVSIAYQIYQKQGWSAWLKCAKLLKIL